MFSVFTYVYKICKSDMLRVTLSTWISPPSRFLLREQDSCERLLRGGWVTILLVGMLLWSSSLPWIAQSCLLSWVEIISRNASASSIPSHPVPQRGSQGPVLTLWYAVFCLCVSFKYAAHGGKTRSTMYGVRIKSVHVSKIIRRVLL